MITRCVLLLGIAGLVCTAQEKFEIGGAAGYGLYKNRTITRGSATAEAGFRSGLLFGIVAGNDMHRLVGGEVRYTRRDNDLKLSSGGTDATFSGEAHILHYDMLVHATPREARLRPFIAFGGGIKYYRGTGAEQEFQPLQNFAVLTRTSEWLPMLSVGGGVKFRIAKHALVRFDFRDYMTPFPTRVILPAGGASVSGWLHDLTPMVGISAFF
jgi:hypothetical protein